MLNRTYAMATMKEWMVTENFMKNPNVPFLTGRGEERR
jgi:hypothetical protein